MPSERVVIDDAVVERLLHDSTVAQFAPSLHTLAQQPERKKGCRPCQRRYARSNYTAVKRAIAAFTQDQINRLAQLLDTKAFVVAYRRDDSSPDVVRLTMNRQT